jgi:PAS domain S-box-containing protein
MGTDDAGSGAVVAPHQQGGEPPCLAHLFEPATEPDAAALADLVRQLADAVVVSNRDGLVTFWNHAAERLFGWYADDVLGGSLDVIIPERFRARHWAGYRTVMATGITAYGTKLLEVPGVHRDGSTMSLAFTVTLLTDPELGTCTGIAAVIRDDTDAWQQRRALRAELAALRTGPAT